ncbi:MAG TPA: hypothetical protein VM099_11980 [Gemmatimonadaceae bacterium]|nr:hypothetical protein [Gemmatimonadaceae bacterium]
MRPAHVFFFLTPFTALSASAQTLPAPHPLTVQIIDSATREPVVGAEISALRSSATKVTPRNGVLHLEVLPNGDTIRVRRLGYRPVAIASEQLGNPYVVIGLVAIPRTLSNVTVEARMGAVLSDVGFFERRRRLSGFFVDPSQMVQMHPSRTSDIFERAPGTHLSAAASGGRNIRFARAANCAPIVYIDGVLLINEPPVNRVELRSGARRTNESASDILGQQDQGIDEVGVRQIAAVEAYPTATQAPPPYNTTGSNCGVILFWTWNSVNR